MRVQWRRGGGEQRTSRGVSIRDVAGRTVESGRQVARHGYQAYKGEDIEGRSAAVGRFMRKDIGVPGPVRRALVSTVGEPVKRHALGAAERVGALSEEQEQKLRAMEASKQLESREAGETGAAAIRAEAIAKHGSLEAAFRSVYHDILILARQGKANQVDMSILHTMVQEAKVHGVDEDAILEITKLKKAIEGKRPSRYAGVATGAGRMGAAVVGSLAGGARKMEGQQSVAGIRSTITDVREHPHAAAASGVGGIKRPIMDFTPDLRSRIYQRPGSPQRQLPVSSYEREYSERGPVMAQSGEYYDNAKPLPRGGWSDVAYSERDERY